MKSKWRLPTVNELQGVFDYEDSKPKIDGFASDYYWSSTTYEGYTGYAWYVDFYNGYQSNYDKDGSCYVRCVREGDDGGLKWSKSLENKMTWDEASEHCKRMNDER